MWWNRWWIAQKFAPNSQGVEMMILPQPKKFISTLQKVANVVKSADKSWHSCNKVVDAVPF